MSVNVTEERFLRALILGQDESGYLSKEKKEDSEIVGKCESTVTV